MLPILLTDPCTLTANTCPNGDICFHVIASDGSVSHRCEPPCTSNPCANGGICSKDGNDQRHCDCSHTGYGGDNCTVGKWQCE